MKENYILRLRLGLPSGYTDIPDHTNYFTYDTNMKHTENKFKELEECGYKLLNTSDYKDWRAVCINSLNTQMILFRDIEFHNTFQKKDGSILVRWYKIEKSGLIKMKQALYTKPKHLEKPVGELVTIASMKAYNMTMPTYTSYYPTELVFVPYNVKGMLLTSEFHQAIENYTHDEFKYLDGSLPIHVKHRRAIIRKSFEELTDESITNFISDPPPYWKSAPYKHEGGNFDSSYINGCTYYA